ncbi:MAG: hypothetical protein V5A64_03380 [Candidatus Thermoplasmatota archaeon]
MNKEKKLLVGNDKAVSGVLEALLIVALIAIILAVIQTQYIPNIMEQRETEHLTEVEKQFSTLKSTIDIQSMSKEDVPVSNTITLGSKEFPYFVTARATGSLKLQNVTDYNISVEPASPGLERDSEYSSSFPLTSIIYHAYNSYVTDEEYILQGGMVINKIKNVEIVKIPPDIKVTENDTNYIGLRLRLPIFDSPSGKNQTEYNDYLPCSIRTNYQDSITYNSVQPGDQESIKIYTKYCDSWNQSLNQILNEEIENGYISVEKHEEVSPPYVEIQSNTNIKDLHFTVEISRIDVQIGPGIVKT